uniref:EGF-like domain-containing protein n=1 Tax=Clytia hemisphaerica TaxID=252671 RepID=A0A7M5U5P2_9CNID|eukprot:TCONS_00052771-protein
MYSNLLAFLFWCFFALDIKMTDADTIIELQLKKYANPGSRLLNGECCFNLKMRGRCHLSCNAFFDICIKNYLNPHPFDNCGLHELKTKVLSISQKNASPKVFQNGLELRPGVINPWKFTFKGAFTGLSIGILMNHVNFIPKDNLPPNNADETIDKYVLDYSNGDIEPKANRSVSIKKVFNQQNNRANAVLTFAIRAYCATHFHDVDCNTKCIPADDSIKGHYTCHPKDGAKMCKKGWSGHNCLQARCKEGCNVPYATCSQPFGCDCKPGWRHKDHRKLCDKCIANPSCANGYCVKGNDCVCDKDWAGVNCDKDKNKCRKSPCQNGGRCTNDGLDRYKCHCKQGYSGNECQLENNACKFNPCGKTGHCFNLITDYRCSCNLGYTGRNCSENINDCEGIVCLNGGKCEDLVANHKCNCTNGYEGPKCGSNIDDCDPDPCKNGANCNDGIADYTCYCPKGYTGKNCDSEINECITPAEPCVKDQSINCTDKIADFECYCVKGYTGKRCEVDINDCKPDPCLYGDCKDMVNDYKCICQPGFNGTNCENPINECLIQKNICNNGTCIDGHLNYTCQCLPGFTGTFCESDIDECKSLPCSNNGTCVNQVNGFSCDCAVGFEGDQCETDTDNCESNPCQRGNCTNLINDYLCTCPPGYTGKNCKTDINECDPVDICNNGTCKDGINSYQCDCYPGFNGTHCEHNIDECSNQPCENNGTCIDGINDFSCECAPGWTGRLCNYETIECCIQPPCNSSGHCPPLRDVCQNNAQCIEQHDNYTCICADGFRGRNCEEDINFCEDNPCLNGHCQDLPTRFQCECYKGYEGLTCNNVTDKCIQKPCQNAKDCIPGNDTFTCQCKEGFTGVACETNIDNCDLRHVGDIIEGSLTDITSWGLCGRDGTCRDGIDTFSCDCNPGFKGRFCKTDINECETLPSPCNGTGECSPLVGPHYQCKCDPGYTGANCETDINECITPNEKGIRGNEYCCDGANTCRDEINGFSCQCPLGKVGIDCCSNTSWCENKDVCSSHGQCSELSNYNSSLPYHCQCDQGWTGQRCNIDVDECEISKPCKTHGECFNTKGNYSCDCFSGYEGRHCQNLIDYCVKKNVTCFNGFNCTKKHSNYECNCPQGSGYGKHCEDINECEVHKPCGANEDCFNNVGSYQCKCKAGWTGAQCNEEHIVDCSETNCVLQHTDECKVVGKEKFECKCFGRWQGPTCEDRNMSKIDPCGCEEDACIIERSERGIRTTMCQCKANGKGCKEYVGTASRSRSMSPEDKQIIYVVSGTLSLVLVIIIAVVLSSIYYRRRQALLNTETAEASSTGHDENKSRKISLHQVNHQRKISRQENTFHMPDPRFEPVLHRTTTNGMIENNMLKNNLCKKASPSINSTK